MNMKKQYTTPEIDVRKYEVTELLSASRNDDGEIDLDDGLL